MASQGNEDRFIGEKLRFARKKRGITQTQLAMALGLSAQQIQKFEKGVNRISAKTLFRASHVCELPIEWFFTDLQTGNGTNGFTDEAAYYLNNIKNPETQQKVLELIRTLTKIDE